MTDRFEESVRSAGRSLASPAAPSYERAWRRGRIRRLAKGAAASVSVVALAFAATNVDLGRLGGGDTVEVDDVALGVDPDIATQTADGPSEQDVETDSETGSSDSETAAAGNRGERERVVIDVGGDRGERQPSRPTGERDQSEEQSGQTGSGTGGSAAGDTGAGGTGSATGPEAAEASTSSDVASDTSGSDSQAAGSGAGAPFQSGDTGVSQLGPQLGSGQQTEQGDRSPPSSSSSNGNEDGGNNGGGNSGAESSSGLAERFPVVDSQEPDQDSNEGADPDRAQRPLPALATTDPEPNPDTAGTGSPLAPDPDASAPSVPGAQSPVEGSGDGSAAADRPTDPVTSPPVGTSQPPTDGDSDATDGTDGDPALSQPVPSGPDFPPLIPDGARPIPAVEPTLGGPADAVVTPGSGVTADGTLACDATGDQVADASCRLFSAYPCTSQAQATPDHHAVDTDGDAIVDLCVPLAVDGCDTTGDGLANVVCRIEP